MKRKIVSLICAASVILTAAVSVSGAKGDKKKIPEYGGEKAAIAVYSSKEEYLSKMQQAASDDKAELYFDPATANIALKSKADGAVWFSAPTFKEGYAAAAPAVAQRLTSAIILEYTDSALSSFSLNSFSDAAAYGQIKHEKTANGVDFTMTLGKLAASEVVPEIITGERAEELQEKLSEKDYKYLIRSYREIKLKGNDTDKVTLADYPALANGIKVYALRINIAESVRKRLAEYFAEAGYTRENLEEDEIAVYGKLKSEEKGSASFTLKLSYALENGELKVSVPIGEIEYDKSEYRLTDMHLLPYFGADGFGDSGFFLLPDGSGAVSEYEAGVLGSGSPFTLELYGNDSVYMYNPTLEFTSTGLMPVFGQHSGGSGYIAAVESGDAQASVYSIIDESETALRYTGFICRVRPSDKYAHSEQGNRSEYDRNSPNGYEGDFSVRYIPLQKPTYSDMAVAYREYLEKNGKLKANDIPEKGLHIELLGAVESKANGVFSDTDIFALTTFEDAQKIISELQKAGELSVGYLGWANGGLNHTVFSKVKYMSELGGKKGFNALLEAAKKAGVGIYPTVNISHIYKDAYFDGFTAFRNASHQLDNSYARIYPYNLGSSLGDYTKLYYTVKSQSVTAYNNKLLKALPKGLEGLSYEWLGEVVNTDSSKKSGSRSEALKDYEAALKKSAEGLSLELSGGNQYTYKYASAIRRLKNSSSLYRNLSFSVPFVQMVLHGSIPYSSEPLNTSFDGEQSFLKAMENGEQLSYTLAYRNTDRLLKSMYTKYNSVEYSYHKAAIIENAERAEKILAGTYGEKIMKHEYLTPEVASVTYENGIRVIVNYSESEYSSGDVTVKPRDAVQIKIG